MEPVHIQINANSRKLSVINATHRSQKSLTADVKIIDLNMNVLWNYTVVISVDADCYKELVIVPKPMNSTPVYFIKLLLKNQNGEVVSDNLYWKCAQHEDFSQLASLGKEKLSKTVTFEDQDRELKIVVKLKNETNMLSFFNRLMICKATTGEEVLPTFWSDNYITLFPGEAKTVVAIVSKSDLSGIPPVISIE